LITPPLLSGLPKTLTDGKITLLPPVDTYFLGLPNAISASISSFDIVEIPIFPVLSNEIILSDMLQLKGEEGNITDYVFAQKDAGGGTTAPDFYVLKVTIYKLAELSLKLEFDDIGKKLSVIGGTPTIYRSTFNTAGTTLTATFSGASASAIEWTIGDHTSTGNTLVVKYGLTQAVNLLLGGSEVAITLKVTVGGMPYSNVLTFPVTN